MGEAWSDNDDANACSGIEGGDEAVDAVFGGMGNGGNEGSDLAGD